MPRGDENAIICWNCKHIATCRPLYRPIFNCNRFESLGTPITHKEVAQRLGFTYWSFQHRLYRCGIDKIMELCDLCGEDIRYEQVSRHIRFYDVSGSIKEVCV